MAPRVGLEPTTNRLTADRSTTELPRKMEPTLGFEPRTDGLQNRCSTTELCRQKSRARESNSDCMLMRHARPPGLATRDIDLIKPIQ
jgi:hypothetical protein